MNRQETLDALNARGIAYTLVEHPAVYTIEEMEQLGLTAQGTVLKNLFLRDKNGRRHFLVCLPEDRSADLKDLAARIGSTTLSFASEDRLARHLGLTRGAVTPLGVLSPTAGEVAVYLDASLAGKTIGVHPCDNTATVWIGCDDIIALIKERNAFFML